MRTVEDMGSFIIQWFSFALVLILFLWTVFWIHDSRSCKSIICNGKLKTHKQNWKKSHLNAKHSFPNYWNCIKIIQILWSIFTSMKSCSSVGPHQQNWDYYNTQHFPFFSTFLPQLASRHCCIICPCALQFFSGIFYVDFMWQVQQLLAEIILQAHGWSPNHIAKELKAEQYYRPISLTQDY